MLLALSGFMGCGKSSVASELARLWGGFYFDLDRTIEQEEGRSIAEIFAEEGESGFRIMEYDYLLRIVSDFEDFSSERIVLALGGGTVLTRQCAGILKENAKCVYLRASVDTLVSNLIETGIQDRPLLCGETVGTAVDDGVADDGATNDKALTLKREVERLLSERREVYERTADFIIDTDGLSPKEIAEKIDSIDELLKI